MRAIRDALGMSSSELAARLGIAQPSVIALERSEERDTVQLGTLRRAADALDCDLVYFLVPRTSLSDAIKAQAHGRAAAQLEIVAHHMRLEDQAVGEDDTAALLDDLADNLIDRRGLWTDPGP